MDKDYYNRYCPWENLRKNTDRMKELGVSIKIVWRLNNEKNERYRDLLIDLGFQPEYSEVPCEQHIASCVYGYEARKGFRFIEEHLGKGFSSIDHCKTNNATLADFPRYP